MLKFGSKSDVTVVHRATIRLLDDAEIIHCDFKVSLPISYTALFMYTSITCSKNVRLTIPSYIRYPRGLFTSASTAAAHVRDAMHTVRQALSQFFTHYYTRTVVYNYIIRAPLLMYTLQPIDFLVRFLLLHSFSSARGFTADVLHDHSTIYPHCVEGIFRISACAIRGTGYVFFVNVPFIRFHWGILIARTSIFISCSGPEFIDPSLSLRPSPRGPSLRACGSILNFP